MIYIYIGKDSTTKPTTPFYNDYEHYNVTCEITVKNNNKYHVKVYNKNNEIMFDTILEDTDTYVHHKYTHAKYSNIKKQMTSREQINNTYTFNGVIEEIGEPIYRGISKFSNTTSSRETYITIYTIKKVDTPKTKDEYNAIKLKDKVKAKETEETNKEDKKKKITDYLETYTFIDSDLLSYDIIKRIIINAFINATVIKNKGTIDNKSIRAALNDIGEYKALTDNQKSIIYNIANNIRMNHYE